MPDYPGRLIRFMGDEAPSFLWSVGAIELLAGVDAGQCLSLAIGASVSGTPTDMQAVIGLIKSISGRDLVFVGGFHSPLEHTSLKLLIESGDKVLVCVGRSLSGIRVDRFWREPLLTGRMLLVSAASASCRRATEESTRVRNACVQALASKFLALSAPPGSKTEKTCLQVISSGRELWVMDANGNPDLFRRGARQATAAASAEIAGMNPSPQSASKSTF